MYARHITNALVSGNPLVPTQFLPKLTPERYAAMTQGVTAASAPGPEGAVDVDASTSLVGTVAEAVGALGSLLIRRFFWGFAVVVTEPDRLVTTLFVSRGFQVSDTNLSMLESAPLFAVLAGGGVVVLRRRLGWVRSALRSGSPAAAVNTFAIVYGVFLVSLALPELPIEAPVTVRYLLPLYPRLLYAVLSMGQGRELIDEEASLLVWTYLAGTLIGTQLLLAGVVLLDAALREAMQLNALLGLIVAGALGVWSAACALGVDSTGSRRAGAVLLGLAAAVGTAFVLISAWWYFGYGPFALPFVPRS